MRIWIDLSAPAHPVVFRPHRAPAARGRPRGRGDGSRLRARRSSSREIARARRARRSARTAAARPAASCAASPAARLALWRWARTRPRFDLAAAHGSNDLPIVARTLRVPAVDLFDYEWATFQHMIGCRLARRVIVPEAIPPERLRRYGAGPRKLRRYPGLKEEYFLHDFEPDPGILAQVGADPERIIVVMRTPPTAALYHRVHNPVYAELLDRVGHDPGDPRRRAAAPARAGRGAAAARAALRDRARARRRRPEPRLGRRPRDLGRRQHEPRGRRARRAGLHDVPGAHGRRRREAHARGQAAPPGARGRRRHPRAATAARRACAATRS